MIGIGDPTRLIWLDSDKSGVEPAAIYRTLIRGFSYWIACAEGRIGNIAPICHWFPPETQNAQHQTYAASSVKSRITSTEDDVSTKCDDLLGLITHPPGMTGYVAAAQALARRMRVNNHSSADEWIQVASRLLAFRSAPDREQAFFDELVRLQRRRWAVKWPVRALRFMRPWPPMAGPPKHLRNRPFLYLTTDPIADMYSRGEVAHERIVEEMWQTTNPRICMTALLVTARVRAASSFVDSALAEVRSVLEDAITLLLQDPAWCADVIWSHFVNRSVSAMSTDSELIRKHLAATPFFGWTLKGLHNICHKLANAHSSDPKLPNSIYQLAPLGKDDWHLTLDEHEPIWKHIFPRMQIRPFRSREAMEGVLRMDATE